MALNKKFFPKVSADAAADTFTPSEHFNTVLYTGTGASQRIGGYINRGGIFNGSSSGITLPKGILNDGALKTFSISLWFQTSSTSEQMLVSTSASSSNAGINLNLQSNGYLIFQMSDGSSNTGYMQHQTDMSDGDWHHVVVTYSSAGGSNDATTSFYLDGTDITSSVASGNSWSQGSGATFSSISHLALGRWPASSLYYLNGKLDQVRFFNKAISSSEAATLYGETHSSTTISTTDIFSDNSGVALYQLDGNANATGSVPEIAFDSTINTSSIAYTVNNRKIAGNTGGSFASTRVTKSKSSGKWYFEMYYNDSSAFASSRSGLGLLCPTCTMTTYLGGTSQDEWAVFNGGNVINNGSSVHNESLGDFSVGNVIMCALDLDNQKVYFGKNGTWFNSANPSNGTNSFTLSGSEYYAAGWVYNTSDQLTFRFREGDFSYTVPTGFSAYSETNYDGTASNITYQEATKFQPDMIWFKNRTGTNSHAIIDSVRGRAKSIYPDDTFVENTSEQVMTL